MSSSVQTLATALSTDMNYYAGDPAMLKGDRYKDRMSAILSSKRADQLAVRVAIHALLREAFKSSDVQKRLTPYLDNGEEMETYIRDSKARAKFFSRKQQTLQAAIIMSKEQKDLKEAHGELAAWEKDNAVLLRHQMFMTYMPSQALLLESAATVALYRQYASIEEGEYTSESSDGEIPAMLKKMGGKTYFTQAEQPFEVDEHNKMFSQQVLQNKRVEYEQMREKVAKLREALEECPTVQRLERFIGIRNEIYATFGIDRLVSLASRKDKELGDPNEGGSDLSLRGLAADNEFVMSCRVAQYSLPKIVEACYKNYLNILSMDDWDAMMKHTGNDARTVIEHLKPLKDRETFRYWFLSCLTADVPQTGPNKIVGKATTVLEDYKKFWFPQKSSYVPSMTPNRAAFGKNADRHGLPHIVVLSPATYSYRENNDPNSVKRGELDLVVYDMTNEKVLLMIVDSTDDTKPRGAFLNAQEERYRFAAVVRSAITYDNQLHDFQCSGTVAEYFFDPEQGPEENYYCVMAPYKVYQKQPMQVSVPVKAFRPFTACPPRYFALGSNWGVSAGTARNPYPTSYAHIELNEMAIALSDSIPDGFVAQNVLPKLKTRAEGLLELEQEKKRQEELQKQQQAQQSPRGAASGARTPRTGRTGAATAAVAAGAPPPEPTAAQILAEEEQRERGEEEDPLSPVVPADALHPVADQLMKAANRWATPGFVKARDLNSDLKALPAVAKKELRTPLNVFTEIMKEKHGEDVSASSAPVSARRSTAGSATASQPVNHRNTDRQAANVAWF